MAFLDYAVPVISGFFILVFLSIFGWVIHKLFQTVGIYKIYKNFRMGRKKKKILEDEKIIEYCVKRIESDWTEAKVREELLLANKYSSDRIEEMVYAFNTIKKEMGKDNKKTPADLP